MISFHFDHAPTQFIIKDHGCFRKNAILTKVNRASFTHPAMMENDWMAKMCDVINIKQ